MNVLGFLTTFAAVLFIARYLRGTIGIAVLAAALVRRVPVHA